jgi:hypothetical protein
MAIDGFDGDFALSLGSVVGVRAFDTDWLGRLTGVSNAAVFKPEQNTAACFRCQTRRLATCECGFYAYFSGQDNQYMYAHAIGGIIEGTGRTVVGTKGFRTEKATLLALFPINGSVKTSWSALVTRWLYPTYRWFDHVDDEDFSFPGFVIAILIAALLGLVGVISLFTADWELGTWMVPLAAWFAGFARRFWLLDTASKKAKTLTRIGKSKEPDPFDRLRELYPETPIYKNLKAALNEHPLTAAEEHAPVPTLPSPSTEDNFWELPTTPGRQSKYGR